MCGRKFQSKTLQSLVNNGTDAGAISSGRRDNFSRSAVCELGIVSPNKFLPQPI